MCVLSLDASSVSPFKYVRIVCDAVSVPLAFLTFFFSPPIGPRSRKNSATYPGQLWPSTSSCVRYATCTSPGILWHVQIVWAWLHLPGSLLRHQPLRIWQLSDPTSPLTLVTRRLIRETVLPLLTEGTHMSHDNRLYGNSPPTKKKKKSQKPIDISSASILPISLKNTFLLSHSPSPQPRSSCHYVCIAMLCFFFPAFHFVFAFLFFFC